MCLVISVIFFVRKMLQKDVKNTTCVFAQHAYLTYLHKYTIKTRVVGLYVFEYIGKIVEMLV